MATAGIGSAAGALLAGRADITLGTGGAGRPAIARIALTLSAGGAGPVGAAGGLGTAWALLAAIGPEKARGTFVAGASAGACPAWHALSEAFDLVVVGAGRTGIKRAVAAVTAKHVGSTPQLGAGRRAGTALHPCLSRRCAANQTIAIRAALALVTGALGDGVRARAAECVPTHLVAIGAVPGGARAVLPTTGAPASLANADVLSAGQ